MKREGQALFKGGVYESVFEVEDYDKGWIRLRGVHNGCALTLHRGGFAHAMNDTARAVEAEAFGELPPVVMATCPWCKKEREVSDGRLRRHGFRGFDGRIFRCRGSGSPVPKE